MSEPERTPRRRDAEATRLAILEAGKAAFGRAAYDQVSLREIASAAEVDVALIGRYFGSKEELFAAVIASRPHPPHPLPEDRSRFGEWLARLMLANQPKDPTRFLLLHHSVANPRAAEIVRTMLTDRFVKPIGAYLGGPDGELRAGLLLGHITGFGIVRHIIRAEPMSSTDAETIVAVIAPILQSYVRAAPPQSPEPVS